MVDDHGFVLSSADGANTLKLRGMVQLGRQVLLALVVLGQPLDLLLQQHAPPLERLDLVARLQAQIVRHQFQLSLRPGRPQRSLPELLALVEAIADRRPDRAEAATVAHFHQVIAALEQSGER